MNESFPPVLPGVRVHLVEDRTASSRCDEGYLRVRRGRIVAQYGQAGEDSAPFAYDVLERWCPDAVAVLLHFLRNGERFLLLRSCVRPPLALRRDPYIPFEVPLPPGATEGELWEIPAGVVEANERTPEGLRRCAAREVEEEAGVRLEAQALRPLGGPLLPSAGSMGECVYLFEAELASGARAVPRGDGPLERHGQTAEVRLVDALDWCERGLLPDGKTELAIRRLVSALQRRTAGSLPSP